MEWQTPLWKMAITDEEFEALRAEIKQLFDEGKSFAKKLASKKIALYYAEWWKREYNGHAPSSEKIAESIGIDLSDSAELFELAKAGGEILGFRWIKRQNTLYFRTLLLQGGLPTLHIKNNTNSYKSFLLKVLELQPRNIFEISENHDLIRLLPPSSRNEVIYESCLQIIEDIWSNSENAYNIFGTGNELEDIGKALRIHKAKIEKEKRIHRNIQASIRWVLRKSAGDNWKLMPEFRFPGNLSEEEMSKLVGSTKLTSEYFIVFDEEPICRLRRSSTGNFRTFWLNEAYRQGCNYDRKVEIHLKSPDGSIRHLDVRGTDPPDLSLPVLLVENAPDELVFCQGRNSKDEEGVIIFPEGWKLVDDMQPVTITNLSICDMTLNTCHFRNTITLEMESETMTFNTNSASFQWYMVEQKPLWMTGSSLPIVRGIPKFFIYDVNEDLERNNSISYRRQGDLLWQQNPRSLPLGCIDYEINARGVSEYGSFYNIGDLNIENVDREAFDASLKVHNTNFSLTVIEDQYLAVALNNSTIALRWLNPMKFPKEIRFKLCHSGQRKSLAFYISPPFRGVKITDAVQNVLPDKCCLFINNLLGYRIISTEHILLRLYNTHRSDIFIEKQLSPGTTSIIEFQEEIHRLFSLYNALDPSNSVLFEFRDGDEILNMFEIKNHNLGKEILTAGDDIRINVEQAPETMSLYAIQLDCSPKNIEPFPLERDNNSFLLTSRVISNFIIFSIDTSDTKSVLPFSATTDSNEVENPDKIKRTCENLKNTEPSDSIWQQTIIYSQKANYYKLPMIAFDHCRAIALSPKLSARYFCLLRISTQDVDEFSDICHKFEQELGISFHWLSGKRWAEAMDWALSSVDDRYRQNMRCLIISDIDNFICEGTSNVLTNKLLQFIKNGTIPQDSQFHLKTSVRELQARIGNKISELPAGGPSIAPLFRFVIPVEDCNSNLWPVLLTPLSVALSVTGRSEYLFSENPHVRSNLQYIQWRFPIWYMNALLYCIRRLSS